MDLNYLIAYQAYAMVIYQVLLVFYMSPGQFLRRGDSRLPPSTTTGPVVLGQTTHAQYPTVVEENW